MAGLKDAIDKLFGRAPSGAPIDDRGFEWNPDAETVAPTSAKAPAWKTVDPGRADRLAEPAILADAPPRPTFGVGAALPGEATLVDAPGSRQAARFEPAPVPAVPATPARSEPAIALSDFEEVYRRAGIKSPVHGYGVERVHGLISSRRLRGVDRAVRRSALITALDAAAVPPSDVMQDAVLRRKALAAHEAEKALELQSLRSRNEQRIEALEESIDAMTRQKQATIENLSQASAAAVRNHTDLEIRARMEQERLYRALGYFVEPLPPPIPAVPAKGAAAALPAAALAIQDATPPASEVSPAPTLGDSSPESDGNEGAR